MKNFSQLVEECRKYVKEIMPWDLLTMLESDNPPLVLDVREPDEFHAMHIEDSLHVPRGVLEAACDWGYEETIPGLVEARDKPIVVVCRSGNRSLLAAKVMHDMGYKHVLSLNTGLRGWNDYEQQLVDQHEKDVEIDDADEFFDSKVSKEQLGPLAKR